MKLKLLLITLLTVISSSLFSYEKKIECTVNKYGDEVCHIISRTNVFDTKLIAIVTKNKNNEYEGHKTGCFGSYCTALPISNPEEFFKSLKNEFDRQQQLALFWAKKAKDVRKNCYKLFSFE